MLDGKIYILELSLHIGVFLIFIIRKQINLNSSKLHATRTHPNDTTKFWRYYVASCNILYIYRSRIYLLDKSRDKNQLKRFPFVSSGYCFITKLAYNACLLVFEYVGGLLIRHLYSRPKTPLSRASNSRAVNSQESQRERAPAWDLAYLFIIIISSFFFLFISNFSFFQSDSTANCFIFYVNLLKVFNKKIPRSVVACRGVVCGLYVN